jgi:pyruvate/2-oxoglutarate/acetoin dehydrogenase E1 component
MDNSDLRKLVGNQNNSQLVVQDLAVRASILRVIHQHFALVFENIPGCRVVSFYEALDSKAMEVCFASLSK